MSVIILLFSLLIVTCSCGGNGEHELEAYYTNLPDTHEALVAYQDSLFGRYSDLVIEWGDIGQIIFSRETSFLPVWKTAHGNWSFPEVIPRKGDGDERRPDIISKYSHTRLIEKSPRKMIIHWRYFPEFEAVEWGDVVDEYFTIGSNGEVERLIRPGTETINEWEKGYGILHQQLRLTSGGIELIPQNGGNQPQADKTVEKDEITGHPEKVISEVLFKFDENLLFPGDQALESVSGKLYKVSGPKVLQKKGISGKALQFDGYYSGIAVLDFQPSEPPESLTMQAWFALGAYPFDWAPLIQQSEWGQRGFYLGINEDGYPGFHVASNNQWISLVDSSRLDLFRWHQISASVNRNSGDLVLYLDGEKVAAARENNFELQPSDTPLFIGLNRQKMPAIRGRISRGKWPSLFGIDGLIDEVEIKKEVLSAAEVRGNLLKPSPIRSQITRPDMAPRKMPVNPQNQKSEEFSAVYTKLQYYETWDNLWRVSEHPDIVISFDRLPVNIVFWRGTSYGPFFVTENGKWIGDQSNEDYRHIEYKGEAEGCLEHMSDKQCRHSHVRIIEDTEARKLIHWRYGLVDSRYLFAPRNGGWGGWTDEYWTIYPDGVAVRNVTRGIVFGDGWVETMFLNAPGSRPEDNVELEALTVITGDGNVQTLSWEDGSPDSTFDDVRITMVNSKSQYRMFNVYPSGSSIEVFGGHSQKSHFHWWNHWPVSQITSDGRGARAADRLAHSSLVWGAPGGNFLMYGISSKSPERLLPLANSWNSAPVVSNKKGFDEIHYLQEERAYHLKAQNNRVSFAIEASEKSPLLNPAFVLKGWSGKSAGIKVNGVELNSGKKCRIGYHRTAEGLNLIIWLELTATSKTSFEFKNNG